MLWARKLHPHDGTQRAGKPIGDWLRVISITDHVPVDGPYEQMSVATLDDGTWEFIWNLQLQGGTEERP